MIHSLRVKPMALASLAYRHALWPHEAYKQAFDALLEARGERVACKTMMELLSLAHERAVGAELAAALGVILEAGELPELAGLRARFVPATPSLPDVTVTLPTLATFDALLPGCDAAAAEPSCSGDDVAAGAAA